MVVDERRMFGVAWWGWLVVVVRFRVSDGGWLMGVLDVFFGWRVCGCSCGWFCLVVVGVRGE